MPAKDQTQHQTRKAGYQKKKVVTPEVLETIAKGFLCGKTLREIGREVGINHNTVDYHLEKTIRPVWREHIRDDLKEDLAKVALIEREAWKRYRVSQNLKDLDLVTWAIEHRAKIAGHYAPAKLEVGRKSEVRVAGKTPAEFNEETLRMIVQRTKERRAYEDARKEYFGRN